MSVLASTEPIGTTARLAGARLGAVRLGAVPRASQLTAAGLYTWVRSDGPQGAINRGQPALSVIGGWITVRS